MKYILILLFLCLVTVLKAEIYYIDANNGNDSYSGKTPEQAWKSISKVNAAVFKPGDQILFNRGSKWIDMLVPSSSGSKNQNITYGAYGEGSLPVITTRQTVPNSSKKSKWISIERNIYSLVINNIGSIHIDRLWLDNIEYGHSHDIYSIDKKHRWLYDNNNKTLYVYAESNPAEFYKSIEFPGGTDNKFHTIQIKYREYLTFKELDIQGGYIGSVGIKGSNNIIFEKCSIGKYAHGRGVIGNQFSEKAGDSSSNYIIIRNNLFDSGWKIFASYERSIMDAVSIQNGAAYWEVYNNKFINWDHSAVQIYGIKAPACYNKVFSNFVTAPDIAYSRAFETVGKDSLMCSYNEFYRNRVSYTTVRNQFGGTYNKIYYNIFDHMKNSTVEHGGQTTAQAINFAKVAGPSKYNIACNNTIYATGRDGIWDSGDNNIIINNLIIDPGRENKGNALKIGKKVRGSTWKNNLIYVPGSTSNKSLINYQERKYTLYEFNKLDGNNEHKISGNIQYDGKLNDLIVDPDNDNFTPSKNSPVINAGIEMGFREDFYGNPISGQPDIGAVEYSPENLGKK